MFITRLDSTNTPSIGVFKINHAHLNPLITACLKFDALTPNRRVTRKESAIIQFIDMLKFRD